MNLSGPIQVYGINTWDFGTTQLHPLGTIGMARDGRLYRYVKAGAADLVAGNVIQSPAIVVNHLALTPAVAAIGATSFTATLGATLSAANQYAEGYVQVDTTPGNGYMYSISGHAAVAQSGVITINLMKDDPLQVALTGSSTVGLLQNPYSGVIQLPVTTATGSIVGIATSAMTAANYGWILTRGLAPVLITGTPALGAQVLGPGTVAGAAQVIVAAGTLLTAQMIGNMAQIGVDGKNNAVMVRID